MKEARLSLTVPFVLALLWAGAGPALAAPAGPGPDVPSVSVHRPPGAAAGPSVELRGLTPAQKAVRKTRVKRCRKVRAGAVRKRCLRQVRARFRRIARRQARERPARPASPTAIHRVLLTDNTTNPIQSSYFIPYEQIVRDESGTIIEPPVPTALRIRAGEAVRFIWDDNNRDSPHTIAPWQFPSGVDRWDFTFGASAALGIRFQRTFTVPGHYEFRCSLHHETQILELEVDP